MDGLVIKYIRLISALKVWQLSLGLEEWTIFVKINNNNIIILIESDNINRNIDGLLIAPLKDMIEKEMD